VLKVTDTLQRSQRRCNAFGGRHAPLAPGTTEVIVCQFRDIRVLTPFPAYDQ